jgi:hypothetical protein
MAKVTEFVVRILGKALDSSTKRKSVKKKLVKSFFMSRSAETVVHAFPNV